MYYNIISEFLRMSHGGMQYFYFEVSVYSLLCMVLTREKSAEIIIHEWTSKTSRVYITFKNNLCFF